jgi:diguanylate cyclase (GGDEF)-like protein
LDEEDRLLKSAVGAYCTAIRALRDMPAVAEPDVARVFKEALRAIETQVEETRDAEMLDASSKSLRGVAAEYCSKAQAWALKKEDDLQTLLQTLCEAAQILGQKHSGQAERLTVFANNLHDTEKAPDLTQMRRRLAGHVQDLRTIAVQTRSENEHGLSALQNELSEFRERLENAEQRASRDALTGLLNRGEGEAILSRLIEKGVAVTAILIDLNGFKKINDSWGHAAGDQILRTCSRVLTSNTRFSDVVCRWGGDEFLVVLRADEQTARQCASRIEAQLRNAEKVVVMGKVFEISASASIGIASCQPGENHMDLIARADAEMYKTKCSKPSSSPVLQ